MVIDDYTKLSVGVSAVANKAIRDVLVLGCEYSNCEHSNSLENRLTNAVESAIEKHEMKRFLSTLSLEEMQLLVDETKEILDEYNKETSGTNNLKIDEAAEIITEKIFDMRNKTIE
jgi:hypothetical protein